MTAVMQDIDIKPISIQISHSEIMGDLDYLIETLLTYALIYKGKTIQVIF